MSLAVFLVLHPFLVKLAYLGHSGIPFARFSANSILRSGRYGNSFITHQIRLIRSAMSMVYCGAVRPYLPPECAMFCDATTFPVAGSTQSAW